MIIQDLLIDWSQPIFYNDDVFGRTYNAQTAKFVGAAGPGRYKVLVGDGSTIECNAFGFETGHEEPSVFNGELEGQ